MTVAATNEELVGVFRSTRFARDDFIIGSLDDGSCVLGSTGSQQLVPGLEYRFMGRWVDSDFGRQFKFSGLTQGEPHSRHGVVEYLKKFCPNVGPVLAHKLCDTYGENNCIGVLKTSPERVAADIPQLNNGRAREAAEALIAQQAFQSTYVDLLDLFAGRGFWAECIDRCIELWGVHAAKRVRKDPFCLLTHKMPGCGFLTVDRLYIELGNEPDRITRRVICAWHCVREDRSGSTWLKWDAVIESIAKLLSGCQRMEVAIEIAVYAGWLSRECVNGEVYLAETTEAEHEKNVSERLVELIEDY